MNGLLVIASLFGSVIGVPLVEDGKAVCEIAVSDRRSEAVAYAADELSRWLGEITGAAVPRRVYCVCRERCNVDAFGDVKTRIYLEMPALKGPFKADALALARTDGFAVRTVVTNGVSEIRILGATDRGILNGVYSFLEENTDIIWPRPEPALSAIFTKTATLVATKTDYREIPKSTERYWGWGWHSPGVAETEFESRNRGNAMKVDAKKYAASVIKAGKGHGFPTYTNPKENFEKHPEWYALVNGKRSSFQVCFLAYDAIPEILKNVTNEIEAVFRTLPRNRRRIDYFNLSNPDSWMVCQCPRCQAPFTCEDGKTVVQPDDPAFRSAQSYTMKNKIARELKRIYRGAVDIGEYAYYYTTEPPPFALETNFRVQYCPYGEDMKKPISDDVANGNWHRLLDAWGKCCRKVNYRSYAGCGQTFPRPIEYTYRSNLVYCLTRKFPVREFYQDADLDINEKPHPEFKIAWDCWGMQLWLMQRLWWDPTVDLEELRERYCRRAYHAAWEPMLRYQNILRDSFYADNYPSMYNSVDSRAYMLQYVKRPGLMPKIYECLKEALAKADHPLSKELIRRQLDLMTKWDAETQRDNYVRMNVPYNPNAKGLEANFDEAAWEKAGSTGDFVMTCVDEGGGENGEDLSQKPRYRSTARLWHDRLNLYVRFDCWAPDMATFPPNERRPDGKEISPRGDIVEFYVCAASVGTYYLMMLDRGHDDPKLDCVYDAKVMDSSWNANWERHTKRYDDKWSAIVKIPFDSVGILAAQSGKVLFQAIRQKYFDTGKTNPKNGKPLRLREMSSWNGGYVHQIQNFGELVLDLN